MSCDSLDKARNIQTTETLLIDINIENQYDTTFCSTAYTYLFDSDGRIIVKKSVRTCVYPSSDDDTFETVFYYQYADFDSVISVIETDGTGKMLSRVVYEYAEKTHQKTDMYSIHDDLLFDPVSPFEFQTNRDSKHIVYTYDTDGSLEKEETYAFCESAGNESNEKRIHLTTYKNGLRYEDFSFDVCVGVCTETITYSYTFW
jgi:hypothetical protein